MVSNFSKLLHDIPLTVSTLEAYIYAGGPPPSPQEAYIYALPLVHIHCFPWLTCGSDLQSRLFTAYYNYMKEH